MSLIRLVLVFLLILPQAFVAQQRYQSLLWKVTGPDVSKPSYLYGTMHISGKLAFQLGDPFYNALESVDVVALELEPEAWLEAIQNDPNSPFWMVSDESMDFSYDDLAFESPLPTLMGHYRIDTDLQSRLRDALMYDPELLNYLLFRFADEETSTDFEEETWLDMHIYQTAKKLGKSTIGLETYAQSDEFMRKAALAQFMESEEMPWGDPEFLEKTQLQSQLEPAYRNQDLDLIDSLNRLTTSKAFQQYILHERNVVFIQSLDSLIKAGRTTFAAMGCAHLPGEKGVIESLRAMGYTVEPVNKGQRNAKRRKAYESKICNREFLPYVTSDQQFKFYTPTKVYPLDASNNSASWISLDIANGASFSVTRLKSYAALTGKRYDEIMSSVDAIIYESVAGEVISNERIRLGKYEGFDIVSRTRRGDFRRQRIIILPEEVIVLKLTAPGEKVKQGYGAAFFEKPEWLSDQPRSTVWEAPDGTMHVNLPGLRVCYEQQTEWRRTPDFEVVAADNLDKSYYLIQRHVIEDPQFIDEDKYELTRLMRAYCADRNARAVNFTHSGTGEMPSLSALLAAEQQQIYVRFVLHGLAYYAFSTNEQDAQLREKFFGSIAFKHADEMAETRYVNDELFFETVLPYSPIKSELSAEMLMFNPEVTQDADSPFGTNGSYVMNRPGDGATLNVMFQRYHEFSDGESRESFQQEKRERATGMHMQLISAREEWSDSGAVFNYVVGDTGSVRRYMHTIYLHNKSCYNLWTTYDSLLGPSPWILKAIGEFVSTDTIFPFPHFSSRDDAYFDALISTDSTARKKALAITAEMDFAPASAVRIRSVFDSLSGYSPEERQQIIGKLIEGLSADTTKASIDFIRREFLAYSDSAEYQEMLLSALLQMKTSKSWSAYRDLVLEEPPIVTEDWNGSCWILLDSVKLAAPLLNDLKQLLVIDEYREPIYRLMAQAADSGWLKADSYAALVPQLLMEARNELKRLSANKESGYAFNTQSMLDYCALLQPFRSRKEVSAFFAKTKTTKRTALLLDLIEFDLKHKFTVEDSLIQRVARNDEFVHSLYRVLRDQGQVQKMPPYCSTREDLLRAYLKRIDSPEFVGVADSTVIIKQYTTSIRNTPLQVYYGKVFNAGYNQWFGKVLAFEASRDDNAWPMFIESGRSVILESDDDAIEILNQEFQHMEEQNREYIMFGYGGEDFFIQQY